jgi:hypothetical protein
MNVPNPQQVIDDFERLLCELTENRKLSLYTAEKAVNIYTLALLNLTRHCQNNPHLKKSNKTKVVSFTYFLWAPAIPEYPHSKYRRSFLR